MQIIDPVRVRRSYTQKLRGKPADVFPLLCPVREREWAEGWDPLAVYSTSGFAENDCIFTTGEENPESFWVITDFDPLRYRLEIVKVTPGMTVARITISPGGRWIRKHGCRSRVHIHGNKPGRGRICKRIFAGVFRRVHAVFGIRPEQFSG